MSIAIEPNNFSNKEILISSTAKNVEDRIYLYVPFESKNKCRFYGGKWDTGNKRWYFINDEANPESPNYANVDREELMQWANEPKKIYYRIPYDNREGAKQLGLHFDKEKKKWFHFDYQDVDIEKAKQLQKWIN